MYHGCALTFSAITLLSAPHPTRDEMKGLMEEIEKEKALQLLNHERHRESWREKENKLNLYIEDLILEADKARAEKVEIATEKVGDCSLTSTIDN